jgi:chloramphenicol-sensitive protein RarD
MTEADPKTHTQLSYTRKGLAYGLSAYTMWGIFPLYFRVLTHVPPFVILCHRILWSSLFLAGIVSVRREWPMIRVIVSQGRSLRLLIAGAILIAINWLVFIYAVSTKQVLQCSLGYFINPLVSVALGMVFFGEKLRGWQWVAVGTAGLAVVSLAWGNTTLPWIAVSLALSFGFYGLVRKKVDANSLHCLLVETVVLLPMSLLVLVFYSGAAVSASTWGILSLSGFITATPLLLFGAALRRLKLSTIGFLQYIGPTLQLLVAIWVIGEPMDRRKLLSFALCWLAIVIYMADSLINRQPPPVADEPD